MAVTACTNQVTRRTRALGSSPRLFRGHSVAVWYDPTIYQGARPIIGLVVPIRLARSRKFACDEGCECGLKKVIACAGRE